MIGPWNSAARGGRGAHHFSLGVFLYGIARVLFIVLFAVVLFLLGQAMVSHRFFHGGRYNRNGTLQQ
jgi:hypothetical protein